MSDDNITTSLTARLVASTAPEQRIKPAVPELQEVLDSLLESLRNDLQAFELLRTQFRIENVADGHLKSDMTDAENAVCDAVTTLECQWADGTSLAQTFCGRAGTCGDPTDRYCPEHIKLFVQCKVCKGWLLIEDSVTPRGEGQGDYHDHCAKSQE